MSIDNLRHIMTISMIKNALLAGALLLPISSVAQDELLESKGPHVRIKRNPHDGSSVIFRRYPEDRKLVKTTKDANGATKMRAVYLRNDQGYLTAGRIYDGQGQFLFRVRYGYHKQTGQLRAEEMFDAQVKRFFAELDKNGQRKEMPVRRIYYFYDAQGNQSKAISLVPKKGQRADEVFQKVRHNRELETRPDSPFKEDQPGAHLLQPAGE